MYYVYMTAHDVDKRKSHIWDSNTRRVLCGLDHPMGNLGVSVDETWIKQPDPDHFMCVRCKCIALRKIAEEDKQ